MKIYCLDTNVFIEAWNNRYPIDLMPDFWAALEELGQGGIIISPDEVLLELSKTDDDLHKWAKNHSRIFQAPDALVQSHLRRVLMASPRLIDSKKGRNQADPFVVAQALAASAVVVSEEISSPGSKSPKVPDVCSTHDIECIKLLDFMRQVGLRFQRHSAP
jgi:hypothetical protein